MKKLSIIIGIVTAACLSSCGGFYNNMITNGKISSKEGIAKKRVWFGIAMNIDMSIETAAKNGGITRVATVESIVKPGLFNVLYITKVTGE